MPAAELTAQASTTKSDCKITTILMKADRLQGRKLEPVKNSGGGLTICLLLNSTAPLMTEKTPSTGLVVRKPG